MATVNLGAIKFNWQGAYNNSTSYVADDVVSSGGNSYVCILASTGNAVSNTTYWSLMAQAGTNGTNGTDLNTVLTTQGDIVFRDGSGLQRLAKGTASQVLAINSGATAPEWVAAGGGATERLGGGTFAAATEAIINPTGFDMGSDSTDYDAYRLLISMETNNDSVEHRMRASQDNGSSWLTSQYSYQTMSNTGNSMGNGNGGSMGNWKLIVPTVSNNNPDARVHFELSMIKARDESANDFCCHATWAAGTGVASAGTVGSTSLHSTYQDLDALKIYASAGTIDGCWTMYGLKSS